MQHTNQLTNPISKRYEDYKKATQRLYHCHLCSTPTPFRGETDFWNHSKSYHVEITSDYPDGPIWKQAVQQAASKAKQRDTRKLPIDPPVLSKTSSNDSMKQNYGDGHSASASSRPVSAIAARGSDSKLDSFERLSLDQPNTPGLIPLKRSAGVQQHSPDSSNRLHTRSAQKTRRRRGSSGGHDIEYDRGRVNPSKKLFDPNFDNLGFGKSGSPQSPRLQEARAQTDRPRRDHPRHHHGQHQHHTTTGVSQSQNTSGMLHAVPAYVEEPPGGDDWDEEEPELLLQPETRPISHDQLVHEVKAIYAGLVLVETKCIDIDEKQLRIAQDPDPTKRTSLTPEQWSALTALHKTLLHEHHDFFLASQHPSASEALTKLAEKHAMPARMWKHGIHAYLEVLRYHLPASFDFMITFLNISYSMMALLYETVPMFETTWVECLGDLGRYRMAIGDTDLRDRDVWAGVARLWYGRAADKHPETGRLLHHLGILAKPFSISQLSLYCRSLAAIESFEGAKTSIMTIFRPILAGQLSPAIKQNSMDTLLVKCLGVLFTGRSTREYSKYCSLILDQGMLSKYCDRAGSKFKEIGVSICVSVLSGLMEFGSTRSDGSSRSIIRRAFQDMIKDESFTTETTKPAVPEVQPKLIPNLTSHENDISLNSIVHASRIAFGVFGVLLEKLLDRNVIPAIHSFTAFIKTASRNQKIMDLIEMDIPWSLLAAYLNHYTNPGTMTKTCLGSAFPKPDEEAIGRPLPEDFIMRGQLAFFDYFPDTWFTAADVDDEEKLLELRSMEAPRLSRILWNGVQISKHNKWISYDETTFRFASTEYARSLIPRELPKSFESGILPPELEKLVPPPLDFEAIIPTPTMSLKSDSMDLDNSGPPASPRLQFTQPPRILKRETMTESVPSTRATDNSSISKFAPTEATTITEDTMRVLYEEPKEL